MKSKWKLVRSYTGTELFVGDIVTSEMGTEYKYVEGIPPIRPGSSGLVMVQNKGTTPFALFPGRLGLDWRKVPEIEVGDYDEQLMRDWVQYETSIK